MDPLKRFQRFLNEEEIPNFSDTDKEILEFIKDRTDMIEVGSLPQEIADYTLNQDYFVDQGDEEEGKSFLERAGGAWEILDFIFERSEDFGMTDSVIDDIKNKKWDSLARLYALYRAEELLLASEVLAQKIASGDEELSAEDIQDLEDELELFIAS